MIRKEVKKHEANHKFVIDDGACDRNVTDDEYGCEGG